MTDEERLEALLELSKDRHVHPSDKENMEWHVATIRRLRAELGKAQRIPSPDGFAGWVAAQEREACAKRIMDRVQHWRTWEHYSEKDLSLQWVIDELLFVMAAIRARGKEREG